VTDTPGPLWTKRDVAAHLAVNVRTVERLPIPRIPIQVTGKRPIVRFDPAQVKAWVDARRTRAVGAPLPRAVAGGAR
jgi:hypothetical protein